MKIELKKITIEQLAKGYADNYEQGVVAYGGKLDVRPPYQREFVYGDKERNAVIETVRQGFPLNVMYWAVREDGGYEIIDGQQRTISICQYMQNEFSIEIAGHPTYYHNSKSDKQKEIRDYELMVYFCEGTDSEKLDWFRTINIAGKTLTDQELRNAVYAGSWTGDAKKYFSKTGGPAYSVGSKYVKGTANRQDYLERAIQWHLLAEGEKTIEDYMAKHQHDENASVLWAYYQKVIGWAAATFPKYRKEMKGVDWGGLYHAHGGETPDTDKLEKRVKALMLDDDVQKKAGVYAYVLDGDERHLNVRGFSEQMKREAFERQDGVCVKCEETFEIQGMEADHITPWSKGGKTNAANCQMLCKDCNRKKSGV